MSTHELPDLLRFDSGERVAAADWKRRRQELYAAIVPVEYGGLPPSLPLVDVELLHPSYLGDTRFEHYRLTFLANPPFSYVARLWIPPGTGPFPVMLTGDGCWCYRPEAATAEILRRGYILAEFNRTEIASDNYKPGRTTGIYPLFPEHHFGALAAWAWGYHRCIDFLQTVDFVDANRIAATGHSRGGKAALLAGATDERIALTAPNNSGCGGAGCFRVQGQSSETLADILKLAGYWFGPDLPAFIGRETELPFDQHFLKALVAPRLLLSTEARGDLWANPEGTLQTHLAAREAYRLLSAEERISIWYRDGEHEQGLRDWQALLDCADWHWRGVEPPEPFDSAVTTSPV
jgi:hypothetical protein